jgi:hypothetical protein
VFTIDEMREHVRQHSDQNGKPPSLPRVPEPSSRELGLRSYDVDAIAGSFEDKVLALFLGGQSVNHIVFLLDYKYRIDVVTEVIRDRVRQLEPDLHSSQR